MSLNRLWVFLAVALPVLAALLASLSSVDLAYNLRAGDEMLRTGAIPGIDSWTFTAAGQPWFDQQWGAQVVLAVVDRIGSWTGLALLRAALVGIIFACVLAIGLRRGLPPRIAALVTLAAFLIAAPALALRPQLLGMALFAITLLLVTDRRRRPAWLWAIPLLVTVWANVHGSFFLAPLVIGLAWLEDVAEGRVSRHRTLLVAFVSALAACVTPYGPTVWAYAVGLSTNPEVTRRITEWQPTSIRDGVGLLFFISVGAIVVLIARRGRVIPWPTLVWLCVFAGIGLYAQRGVAWWPLAAAAAVVGLLPQKADPRGTPDSPTMRRLNLVVAALVVVAALALLPAWRPIDARTGVPVGVLTDAPPGVTAALREIARPGDHIFNPQPWGSWLEFSVPDVKVAIDSRIEFFPAAVWDDYERVVAGGDGWQERLEAWDVVIVITQAGDGAFRDRLLGAGWTELHQDADGSILRSAATGDVLRVRTERPDQRRQRGQQHRKPVDVHDR